MRPELCKHGEIVRFEIKSLFNGQFEFYSIDFQAQKNHQVFVFPKELYIKAM